MQYDDPKSREIEEIAGRLSIEWSASSTDFSEWIAQVFHTTIDCGSSSKKRWTLASTINPRPCRVWRVSGLTVIRASLILFRRHNLSRRVPTTVRSRNDKTPAVTGVLTLVVLTCRRMSQATVSGGGGNRTRVPKHFHDSFYVRSRFIYALRSEIPKRQGFLQASKALF
jgi:hypothetical protein